MLNTIFSSPAYKLLRRQGLKEAKEGNGF